MKAGLAQPMDLGDIVSAAWFLCVRHWQPLLPMALVTFAAAALTDIGLVPLAAQTPAPGGGQPPLPHLSAGLTLLVILGSILLLFNQLAFMRFSLGVWLDSRVALPGAYVAATRRFLTAAGAVAITTAAFLIGVATWIGIPVAFYFLVCWSFSCQVCLGEGEVNPLRALRRSRSLVRGAWWRTAATLAGVTLLALLPSILVGWVRSGGPAPAVVFSALATAAGAPFLAAAQTMIYLDLRVRKHESIALTTGGPSEPL